MACRGQDNDAMAAVELIAEHGLEGLGDAVSLLINEAMRLERERYLGVSPFERSPARRGYANGYKPKTIESRIWRAAAGSSGTSWTASAASLMTCLIWAAVCASGAVDTRRSTSVRTRCCWRVD